MRHKQNFPQIVYVANFIIDVMKMYTVSTYLFFLYFT